MKRDTSWTSIEPPAIDAAAASASAVVVDVEGDGKAVDGQRADRGREFSREVGIGLQFVAVQRGDWSAPREVPGDF